MTLFSCRKSMSFRSITPSFCCSHFFCLCQPNTPKPPTHTHTHSNAMGVQRKCIKRPRLCALKIMASPIFCCLEVSHLVNWLPRAQSKFILPQKSWKRTATRREKKQHMPLLPRKEVGRQKSIRDTRKYIVWVFSNSTYRLFRLHTYSCKLLFVIVLYFFVILGDFCCLVAFIRASCSFQLTTTAAAKCLPIYILKSIKLMSRNLANCQNRWQVNSNRIRCHSISLLDIAKLWMV